MNAELRASITALIRNLDRLEANEADIVGPLPHWQQVMASANALAALLSEPSPYDAGWRDGYRRRGAAAAAAGLPSSAPLKCCSGTLELDYEQGTPWGLMPTAMMVHKDGCPAAGSTP